MTAVLLAACGADDRSPAPAVEGEPRALDEAAEMLDQQRLPPEGASEPTAGESPAEATAR